MRKLLTAGHAIFGRRLVERPWLLIEDEHIAAIGSRETDDLPEHDELVDFPEAMLAPVFIDIHVHGGAGHDVMEATPMALDCVGRYLASRGVGGYFPTTVTAPVDATLRALDGLAAAIENPRPGDVAASLSLRAAPLGVHLEGPFLSHSKRGVHPPELLQLPSVKLFERFWEAARGTVRLMTIAPELPGALELIEHATSLGVRVSLGHTDATAAETRAGIAAGGCSATHTFNAMRGLGHREPGTVGAVLDDPALYAEIVCDGIHVDPAVVRLFYKAKGPERAILITDGISATGMPDGQYTLGGLEVEVADGRCLYHGVLAGSVLTLDRAVRNFAAFTGASLATAVRLVTANPALLTGEAAMYGELAPGRSADIVVLTPAGEVAAVFLRGRQLRI